MSKCLILFIFTIIANIDDVLDGFNSTIFAYGQTGSGKTFTMFGPHWDDNEGHQNTLGGYSIHALNAMG